MLEDPGRVRSQIISVVCQIQRFDFDCNLVLTGKVIIRIPLVLGLNPLYTTCIPCAHAAARGGSGRVYKIPSYKNFLC